MLYVLFWLTLKILSLAGKIRLTDFHLREDHHSIKKSKKRTPVRGIEPRAAR